MRSQGLACILASTFVAPAAFVANAAAGEATVHELHIRSQPLDDGLQELARQSGTQIVFLSGVTAGRQAPALDGRYTVEAALRALLAGSALDFRALNATTVEITRTESRSRSRITAARAVRMEGEGQPQRVPGDPEPLEEVTITAMAEGLVATRVRTPLPEIPQTISIITAEKIRQQNDVDLASVLGHAAGMTMTRTNSLDEELYTRAFAVESLHADAGAALNSRVDGTSYFFGTTDMSEYDQIELLRGSDALFGGYGYPGGTVSLVRKRPLRNYALGLSVLTGSWNNRRVELDVTGPVTTDGALRARAVGVFADRDYFYDTAQLRRKRLFATMEYDFTGDATLSLGGSYQWDDAIPFIGGLPVYSDGGDMRLPRAMALAFDWARYRTRVSEAFAQYRQEFAQDWEVKINAAQWRADLEYAYGTFQYLLVDRRMPLLNQRPKYIASVSPAVSSLRTADITFTGELGWFGRRQQVALGGDFTRFIGGVNERDHGYFGPALQDPRTFDPRDYPDPARTLSSRGGARAARIVDKYGAFASMHMDVTGAWSITAGARAGADRSDWVFTGPELEALFGGPFRVRQRNHVMVTPYAGLMYDIDDHYSWYASYAETYQGYGTFERRDGRRLGPARGATMETGIKGQWRDGALYGALVFYRTSQSNVKIWDPAPSPAGASTICCYVNGTDLSRGVDLELSGELLPGWLVGLGYTYNLNESAPGGELSSATPLHLLKIWTSRQLPGRFSRFVVGGSLHAQSSAAMGGRFLRCPPQPAACVYVDAGQERYAVLDLRTEVRIDAHWRVALNVNNAFDKVYYESLVAGPVDGSGGNLLRPWYGEPRNYMLRIDGQF